MSPDTASNKLRGKKEDGGRGSRNQEAAFKRQKASASNKGQNE
jgi:hypothetical protein